MGKELVISSNRHETKVAVLEDDQLVEIYFQRSNEYSLAGSIHKGRVTRVLPGMQSAFVDIGLERDAFLYVSDFFEEHEEYDRIAAAEPAGRRAERAEVAAPPTAAAAGEPQTAPVEPGPDQDLKDRRGRRSRRRRNRGRGFPESKYAAPTAVAEDAAEDDAAVVAEFPVLPGESLAKYGRAAAAMEEGAAGQEPAEDAVSDATADIAAEPPAADDDQAGRTVSAEDADLAPDPAAEAAADLAQQIAEAVDAAGVGEEAGEAAAAAEQRELEAAGEAEDEAKEPEAAVLEAPAEAGVPPESGGESPRQSEAAAGPEAPAEPGGDAAAAAAPSDGEGAATPEPSPQLRADVRGASTRYPHRLSRRMRRKMRNATGEETRENPGEARPAAPRAEEAEPAAKAAPSITDLLKEGQEILVQIAKEPLGQKGARITSHIALPGRFVVYMPTVDHLGVSRKIASDEERHRLRRILQTHRAGVPGGYIVRTAGEGQPEKDIAADMMFLYNLWLDIRKKAESRPAPALVHHDLDIVQRLLRDQLAEDFKAVWCDNEDVYEGILRFVERIQPRMVGQVKMYTRPAPIFDAFNITAELEKALRPKVWLKSGGYIVVNQTEALVAIDVNTGKFVGKSNRLEDTIVRTNTEAIREIVRQIRLRDLGGIIVVDFIDMDERKNRQKVMQALEDEMRRDRAPYKILQFNDFGLVAITRKRVKQSLERTLCSPCPTCDGSGYVKSVQTVVGEILQEAVKIAPAVEGPNVVLRVHPDVAKLLKSTKNDYLEELEEILRHPVLVTGDPLLHPEKWDMA